MTTLCSQSRFVAVPVYFSRRLTDDSVFDRFLDENGVIALDGNKVVLGEPGMGKSAFMRELGRLLGIEPVTAIRFMNARRPNDLVCPGTPLLIDGLDEAMSRREGDAVDRILAQLEGAGSPPFVLSCRSREWEGRTSSNLGELYGSEPSILTLLPFDRRQALAFLGAHHPTADAEHVLDHLTEHNLEELFRNPLTLGLLGKVAERATKLPATRAELFECVCALMWREHDLGREVERLARLSSDDALDAAGAISAGLLFAGAEAASSAGTLQMHEGDVRIAELETLPRAHAARVILSSKLFHSVGPTRAKPIHRVIAEFLGARWLARQARTPRVRRRLLAQLQSGGGVPASLRGLHAWLAFHSPAMAEAVILADPYGLLRYGETAALTPALAESLFDALCRLADDDPYFRTADWDSKTGSGLMVPTLKPRIEATIQSDTSNPHLRSLLIEALVGTAYAGAFATTLEAIILSRDRSFRERDDAAKALLPHRNQMWWRTTIATLTEEGGEDAPRLARKAIERIDAEVSDRQLVSTVFAEMGLTSCQLPRSARGQATIIRSFDRLLAALSSTRIVGLLAVIADYAALVPNGDWTNAREVAALLSTLLARGIDEGLLGPADAALLWRCLGVIEKSRFTHHHAAEKLTGSFQTHHRVRRAVQKHVLANDRSDSLWGTSFQLQRRLVGLTVADVIEELEELSQRVSIDQHYRDDWQDLVQIVRMRNCRDEDTRAAIEASRRDDGALGKLLYRLENPKKPRWELRREREAAKRARKQRVGFEWERRRLRDTRDDLRAGELNAILRPAKAYFDLVCGLREETSPHARLTTWIGSDLRDDALTGFEAVLHRTDLPSPTVIAECLARNRIWKVAFPIMAGLYERVRNGEGVSDLSPSLKEAALLLSYHDRRGWTFRKEPDPLRPALEAEVVAIEETRRAFAQLWIEPALAAGNDPSAGLYKLAHDPEWRAAGAPLAAQWLLTYPDLAEAIESDLIDCLVGSGMVDRLAEVAEARAKTVFRDLKHLLLWTAVDVVVRFDVIRPMLGTIGVDRPDFIWRLRDRIMLERPNGAVPLTDVQAEWIVTEFRGAWPNATLDGFGSGDTNDYDAADFLRALMRRIANDTSVEAAEAMSRLISGPPDSYTKLLRHMAAEQRQKRVEKSFAAVEPAGLASLLDDHPPCNMVDLQALVLDELGAVQKRLIGDDLDSVIGFWTDDKRPRDENRCRDLLTAMIRPELAPYGVHCMTEADMPRSKRADLAFACGSMQLPVEIKGQWHSEVWDAATGQLDARYLIDWRSEQRGIYCVLWFGELPSSSHRRLQAPPDGLARPESAEAMRGMLVDRIPEARRTFIEVVVLDLVSPKC